MADGHSVFSFVSAIRSAALPLKVSVSDGDVSELLVEAEVDAETGARQVPSIITSGITGSPVNHPCEIHKLPWSVQHLGTLYRLEAQ